jgi:hypothetical protein
LSSDKYYDIRRTKIPRLSLYRSNKQNDYRFIDRTVSQQLTAGGTDLLIHKYLGPNTAGTSTDPTQPVYDQLDPTNIQDLLFLENRDRVYDPNIYRLRGHYNVQNLDFDLSQFGLFLNNDIIFITVHYNDMIDIIGRKLMVGDVLELPHLIDYDPLDQTLPTALKRFYQITDANYASEGFSQTWYPHLWRIKCEPLVDSQEFSQILNEPVNKDNYLGPWEPDRVYPQGYVISYGDKNYTAIQEVPIGKLPPDPDYWLLDENQDLKDILSSYNKNISINNALLEEAKNNVPAAGYDTSEFYVVPTYGPFEQSGVLSGNYRQPATPYSVITTRSGSMPVATGLIVSMRNPNYKTPSVAIKVSKDSLKSIWDMTADGSDKLLDMFVQASLQVVTEAPELTDGGSGSVEGTKVLTVQSMGVVTGPYGTADNTYATADQDPTQPGFTDVVTEVMDFRADCDPRYQFIVRSTPQTFGYTSGYLTGDGTAPNGFPVSAGIAFPQDPQVGDYFLRIDYKPQLLYRWDGRIWVRISENVRTETGFEFEDKSLLSGFINDRAEIYLNNTQELIPESQPLSTILRITPDQE